MRGGWEEGVGFFHRLTTDNFEIGVGSDIIVRVFEHPQMQKRDGRKRA